MKEQSVSKKSIKRLAILLAIVQFVPGIAICQEVYYNNFEGMVGPEWSSTLIDTTPSDRHFLGQFANEIVSLKLDSLAQHSAIQLSFDLYVIHTWDGNASAGGPDIWDLSVGNGPTLLHTTFSNTGSAGHRQAYPDEYPGGDHPARTGAAESNTLGYDDFGDTVYRLTYNFPHTDSSIVLNFSGQGATSFSDRESWGLDSLSVYLENMTAIENNEGKIPSAFELQQNFPNPFNPQTDIRFNLPSATHVVLRIFNTLGQEIRKLADTRYHAGFHTVVWDGKDNKGSIVPSGIYFYQINAGQLTQVKKLTLLR